MTLIGLAFVKQHFFPNKPVYRYERKNKKSKTISSSEAVVLAERKIKTMLKSPSTANFSGYANTNIVDIENGYRVSGYVDSQNSYGAMIRSYYTIDIVYIDGGIYYKKLYIH